MSDNKSTVANPSRLVWEIADRLGNDRRAVIAEAVSLGVLPKTASTQFSRWRKERGFETRVRVTKEEMEVRYETLLEIVGEQRPMTVRQVYYQATVRGLVEKTKEGYSKVQLALSKMRTDEILPWDWIIDLTRRVRCPFTYSDPAEAIEDMARWYRKSLWDGSSVYVQVWLEKDALAGVVDSVTDPLDVSLFSARGYSSITFLKEAAQGLQRQERPCYVYHLGDSDPSGVNAAETIERELREYAPGVTIHFERLAVTDQQIEDWNLPSRPTKETDSRSKKWKEDGRGDSVELDAIPPNELRNLVRAAIMRHITDAGLKRLHAIEKKEKEALRQFAATWVDAP